MTSHQVPLIPSDVKFLSCLWPIEQQRRCHAHQSLAASENCSSHILQYGAHPKLAVSSVLSLCPYAFKRALRHRCCRTPPQQNICFALCSRFRRALLTRGNQSLSKVSLALKQKHFYFPLSENPPSAALCSPPNVKMPPSCDKATSMVIPLAAAAAAAAIASHYSRRHCFFVLCCEFKGRPVAVNSGFCQDSDCLLNAQVG